MMAGVGPGADERLLAGSCGAAVGLNEAAMAAARCAASDTLDGGSTTDWAAGGGTSDAAAADGRVVKADAFRARAAFTRAAAARAAAVAAATAAVSAGFEVG